MRPSPSKAIVMKEDESADDSEHHDRLIIELHNNSDVSPTRNSKVDSIFN